jgi:hypothetical protein
MIDSTNRKLRKAQPDVPAGNIAHDDRGNAVWQWAQGAAHPPIDSTTRMLRQLDVPGLALASDPASGQRDRVDPKALKAQRRATGFYPYDGGVQGGAGASPPRRAPSLAAAKLTEKPGMLGRLLGKDRDR